MIITWRDSSHVALYYRRDTEDAYFTQYVWQVHLASSTLRNVLYLDSEPENKKVIGNIRIYTSYL